MKRGKRKGPPKGRSQCSSKDESVEFFEKMDQEEEETGHVTPPDNLSQLSLEILCKIFHYLPIRFVMRLDCMSTKMREAVTLHLRVRKSIDLAEHKLYGWMSAKMTDSALYKLLSRCRDLELLYGFHPPRVSSRRRRGCDLLSIPGIIESLDLCKKLKGIELSNIQVLEEVLFYHPRIQILGTFKNRNKTFPACDINVPVLVMPDNPYITSLHLSGIDIPCLNRLVHVRHLQLRWVQLTNPHPFKDFAAPNLQTFVMAHCAGPTNALKYVPLLANLAAARHLMRLEFIGVPYLGGLIHHIVQDGWPMGAFRVLRCVRFGMCKHALETDLGCIAITASHRLEEISIQPSLSRDSLFLALQLADVCFPAFERLHLGFVDSFPEPGTWTNAQLQALGLAETIESPALITDIGMKAVGSCFPYMKQLEIYNSPYIQDPTTWFTPGQSAWGRLTDLTLICCHTLKLKEFCEFVSQLPVLASLQLESMFREPPKGCSRVGLSAGTGMGLTSSMILNQQLNTNNAVNNNQQPNAVNNQQQNAVNNQQPNAVNQQQNAVINNQQANAENNQQANVVNNQQPNAENNQQPNAENSQQANAENNQQPNAVNNQQLNAVINNQQPNAENNQQPNVVNNQQLNAVINKRQQNDGNHNQHNQQPNAVNNEQLNVVDNNQQQIAGDSNSLVGGVHNTQQQNCMHNNQQQYVVKNQQTNTVDKNEQENVVNNQHHNAINNSLQQNAVINNQHYSSVNNSQQRNVEITKSEQSKSYTCTSVMNCADRDSLQTNQLQQEPSAAMCTSNSVKMYGNEGHESSDRDNTDKLSRDDESANIKRTHSVDKAGWSSDINQSGLVDINQSGLVDINQSGLVGSKSIQTTVDSEMSRNAGDNQVIERSQEHLPSDNRYVNGCASCDNEQSLKQIDNLKVSSSFLSEVGLGSPKDSTSEQHNKTGNEQLDIPCVNVKFDLDEESKICKDISTTDNNGNTSASADKEISVPASSLKEVKSEAGFVVIEDDPPPDICMSPLCLNETSDDVFKFDTSGTQSSKCNLKLSSSNTEKSVNFLTLHGSHFVFDRSKEDIMSYIIPAAEISQIHVPSDACSTFSGNVVNCLIDNHGNKDYEQALRSKTFSVSENKVLEETEEVQNSDKAKNYSNNGPQESSGLSTRKKKSDIKVKPITCTSIKYIEPARYSRFAGLFSDDCEEVRPSSSSPQRSPPLTRSRSMETSAGTRLKKPSISKKEWKGADANTLKGKSEVKTRACGHANKQCCNCEQESEQRVTRGKSLYGKKKGLKRKSMPNVCSCKCHIIPQKSADKEDNLVKDSEEGCCQNKKAKCEDSKSVHSTTYKKSKVENTCNSSQNESTSNKKRYYEPERNVRQTGKEEASTAGDVNISYSSKGTQVKPVDIPKTLIKSQESCVKFGKMKRKEVRRRSYKGPKKNMCDKMTSTHDPVVEHDFEQVLHIKSKTLTSLSISMVGVTDIVLDNCLELSRLTGHACRVLKKVSITNSSKLKLCDFTHCAKLDETYLSMQVAVQEPNRNKVVYLRPMHKVDHLSLERSLFSSKNVNYSLCVIYDYSKLPGETRENKTRVATWGDFFSSINLDLLEESDFLERSSADWASRYPWGRQIYTMYGLNENGSRWELITDLPWLRPLSECPDLSPRLLSATDAKKGVYNPGSKKHFSMGMTPQVVEDLKEMMVDQMVASLPLHCYSCIIYVNMCDISGRPSYDPYFSGTKTNYSDIW